MSLSRRGKYKKNHSPVDTDACLGPPVFVPNIFLQPAKGVTFLSKSVGECNTAKENNCIVYTKCVHTHKQLFLDFQHSIITYSFRSNHLKNKTDVRSLHVNTNLIFYDSQKKIFTKRHEF